MHQNPTELRHPTYVHQSEYAITSDPDEVLTAILGSCVATCLFDPIAGIGGMNHILLPDESLRSSGATLEGVNLMELLINNLMRRGAGRRRLQAKLFGGARVIGGLSDIGARNMKFARDFLRTEDIPVVSESLGGALGRRIRFWPTTGRAKQIYLRSFDAEKEPPRQKRAPKPDVGGDIELF